VSHGLLTGCMAARHAYAECSLYLSALVSRGHIDLDTQMDIYIHYSPPLYRPHPNPFAKLLAFPQGIFFSGKMTSLTIFDMYFEKFDVFCKYLNNIWQYLVNACPAGECPGLYVPSVRAFSTFLDFHWGELHPTRTARISRSAASQKY
jgi:hypothetical protein